MDKQKKVVSEVKPNHQREQTHTKDGQDQLDGGLEETFPASDPVAISASDHEPKPQEIPIKKPDASKP